MVPGLVNFPRQTMFERSGQPWRRRLAIKDTHSWSVTMWMLWGAVCLAAGATAPWGTDCDSIFKVSIRFVSGGYSSTRTSVGLKRVSDWPLRGLPVCGHLDYNGEKAPLQRLSDAGGGL